MTEITDRPWIPLEERPVLPPSMRWSPDCDVPMLARPHWRVEHTYYDGRWEEIHLSRTVDQDTPEGAAKQAWECWERISGITREQFLAIWPESDRVPNLIVGEFLGFDGERYRVVVNHRAAKDPRVTIEERGTDSVGDPRWNPVELYENEDMTTSDWIHKVALALTGWVLAYKR